MIRIRRKLSLPLSVFRLVYLAWGFLLCLSLLSGSVLSVNPGRFCVTRPSRLKDSPRPCLEGAVRVMLVRCEGFRYPHAFHGERIPCVGGPLCHRSLLSVRMAVTLFVREGSNSKRPIWYELKHCLCLFVNCVQESSLSTLNRENYPLY